MSLVFLAAAPAEPHFSLVSYDWALQVMDPHSPLCIGKSMIPATPIGINPMLVGDVPGLIEYYLKRKVLDRALPISTYFAHKPQNCLPVRSDNKKRKTYAFSIAIPRKP